MASEMGPDGPMGYGPPWSGFVMRRGPWMRHRWAEGMQFGPMRPWGPPPWLRGPGVMRGWYPEMGRRFPFGGGPGPRMFERGDLKFALLSLLQEGPKHGYEMMKNLEERMGGFYAPSAGAIYPTLQLLEDRSWATSDTVDGKKVYTITDAGRDALKEHGERQSARWGAGPFGTEGRPEGGPGFGPGFGPPPHGPHHEHHGPHGRHERQGGPEGPWGWGPEWGRRGDPEFHWKANPEVRELARQARELGRTFLFAGRASINQPERIARLRQIVERTRAELEAFLRESQSQGSQSAEEGAAPTSASTDGPVEQL